MAYKTQHYVPVVYLRNWSNDQAVRNRKSKIWRYQISSETNDLVRAEREGCADFFYSKLAAELAERSFHEMENDYGRISNSVIDGANAGSAREKMQWLIIATDLFVRNAAHKNLTIKENFDAYIDRSVVFIKHLSGLADTNDVNAVCDTINDKWSVHFLRYPSTRETHLIASDIPCVPLSLIGEREHCYYMPIGPGVGMLAARSDVEVRSDCLSELDVALLNQAMVVNARDALYSNWDFTSDTQFSIHVKKWRERTARLSAVWTGCDWSILAPTYEIAPAFLKRDG